MPRSGKLNVTDLKPQQQPVRISAEMPDARIRDWRKRARSASWNNLIWDWSRLGISASGREAAESLEFAPSEVFAHPDVISAHPELADYYRLMAGLPKKSLDQTPSRSAAKDTVALCRFMNGHLSSSLTVAAKASRESRLHPIFAEAAKQQGNWPDPALAAVREVQHILVNYATEKGLLDLEATAKLAAKRLKTAPGISEVFDLLAILKDKGQRAEFLEELFKFHLREKI